MTIAEKMLLAPPQSGHPPRAGKYDDDGQKYYDNCHDRGEINHTTFFLKALLLFHSLPSFWRLDNGANVNVGKKE